MRMIMISFMLAVVLIIAIISAIEQKSTEDMLINKYGYESYEHLSFLKGL